MVKKIYNQPTCLVVALGTTNHMLQASSLRIFNSTSGESQPTIENGSDILTKENKSVWDEEW